MDRNPGLKHQDQGGRAHLRAASLTAALGVKGATQLPDNIHFVFQAHKEGHGRYDDP